MPKRKYYKLIMKKKGFTLIELLAVIIVLAIIMVLTIPNVLSSMNKAKDEAMVTFAKKVRRTAQEYAIIHQDEFGNANYITKDVENLMGNTGKYEGSIQINKDGSVDINSLKAKGENKIMCNIYSSDSITTDKIKNKSVCVPGEATFKVLRSYNHIVSEYEFINGMTWREFLSSEYGQKQTESDQTFSTSTWYRRQESTTDGDSYEYVPNGGTGILFFSYGIYCNSTLGFTNNVLLKDGNNIVLLDDQIIKGKTYTTTYVMEC